MRGIRTASRAALPLVTAMAAVGLASAPAWAATPAPTDRFGPPHPPPPPMWVSADQCHRDGGHVIRDRFDPRRWHCIGGRWNGRDVHF